MPDFDLRCVKKKRQFKIINKINPSKNASYNWLGCLGNSPPLGNIIPNVWSVILPYNSPLMKFAILPKKIPIGDTRQIMSVKTTKSFYSNFDTLKSS